jgi:AAA family ATP:ADP antiporter
MTAAAFLRRVFDIRRGEGRRVLWMQLNIFLIISTLLIIKPTAGALFLAEVGVDKLPVVFILTALAAGIVSYVYGRILPLFSIGRTMVGTLLVSVGCLVLFGVFLARPLPPHALLYGLLVWVSIFAVLSASQFWILANVVFNAREAKRLFGIIGAGAISGGIFGGYLTSVLAPLLGSANLLFVAAGFLFVCTPLTAFIWRNHVRRVQPAFQHKQETAADRNDAATWQLILRSEHLRYLTLLIGLSVLVAKLVDYQFSAIASAAITSPDRLAAFFGFWFSNFNILSLLIQLFLTRIMLDRLGVGKALYFLPVAILLGALAILVTPVLWAGILVKMADGSLKQSLNKAAAELLYLPIGREVKGRVKTFIDVFVDSFATGLSGLLLIFVVKGLGLSVQLTSWLVIAAVGAWLYLISRIRRSYLEAFKARVIREDPGYQPPQELEQAALAGLLKVLETGRPKQIIYSLNRLGERPGANYLAPVKRLLDHPEPAVRVAAIEHLSRYRNDELLQHVEPFLADREVAVRIAVMDFLLHQQPERLGVLVEQFFADPDYRMQGAALLVLAEQTRGQVDRSRRELLAQKIGALADQLIDISDPAVAEFWRLTLLKAMGKASLPQFYPYLFMALHEEDGEYATLTAIEAAGETLAEEFIDPLLELLPRKQYKASARAALANYGPAIFPEVNRRIRRGELSLPLLREIPRLYALLEDRRVVSALIRLVDHPNITVSLEALRVLNEKKVQNPQLKFQRKQTLRRIRTSARLCQDTLLTLYSQQRYAGTAGTVDADREQTVFAARQRLIRLLEQRLDSHLERIFRLLGLRYPPRDVLTAYRGVLEPEESQRASAIEFLDNLLDGDLRHLLVPIIETAAISRYSPEMIDQLLDEVPDDRECFAALLAGPDVRLKLAVLSLIEQLDEDRFTTVVEPYCDDPNPKIRDFARRIVTLASAVT